MDELICPRCGLTYRVQDNHWLCQCGSVLEFPETPKIDPKKICGRERSLWRYVHTLPIDRERSIVSMGEGWTPLVPMDRLDDHLLVKLEYTNPSGSYKDRGASVLVSKLLELGIQEVVEDSSGNAGAALAAYAARAGMHCHIYVPASHSAGKMKQILAYGADLVAIEGTRRDTALAAMEAGRRSFYASHAHSPLFVEGCKTMAYELWEQLGGQAPGMVVTPLGQGSILLGLYKGFKELAELGLVQQIPRLVGVQAQACAPLALAFSQGLDHAAPVQEGGQTIAEGIKITEPVRDIPILEMLHATNGAAVAVSEAEIEQSRQELASHGFYVEPTSAVTLAGYRRATANIPLDGSAVLILTGSGLKSG